MATKKAGIKRPIVMCRSDMLRDLSVVRGRATHNVSDAARLNEAINALSQTCASLTEENCKQEKGLENLKKLVEGLNKKSKG